MFRFKNFIKPDLKYQLSKPSFLTFTMTVFSFYNIKTLLKKPKN